MSLDEWGHPLVAPLPVAPELVADARRAVAVCPTLALQLVRSDNDPDGCRGHGQSGGAELSRTPS